MNCVLLTCTVWGPRTGWPRVVRGRISAPARAVRICLNMEIRKWWLSSELALEGLCTPVRSVAAGSCHLFLSRAVAQP